MNISSPINRIVLAVWWSNPACGIPNMYSYPSPPLEALLPFFLRLNIIVSCVFRLALSIKAPICWSISMLSNGKSSLGVGGSVNSGNK